MREAGIETYRANLERANKKGQMTRLRPQRQLLADWLPLVVQGLKDFMRDSAEAVRRRGSLQPISLPLLRLLPDPYVPSYIALRHILDKAGMKKSIGVLGVAREIGSAVEHEARMIEWEARDKGLYYKVKQGLDKDKATAVHRRRVNINRFNKLVKVQIGWPEWTENQKLRVGLDLLDIVTRYTQHFHVGDDPNHPVFQANKKKPKKPLKVLIISEEVSAWLADMTQTQEVLSPLYMPTLMPPKRWEGGTGGGYWTGQVRAPLMIRFKASQESQRGGAAAEYDALDMPEVYKALHATQEVPWTINRRVLEVMLKLWEKDDGQAGLPVREPEPMPLKPGDIDTNKEAERLWRRAATDVMGRNAKKVSKIIASRQTIQVAQRFLGKDFYFPHRVDFRGRIYPIPFGLQPQGNDIARGLLTFAESCGKPVGTQGAAWLAIHLANCWGMDKVPFDDRICFAYDNEKLWRKIAKNPLKNLEWAGVKKTSFQALAAVFEFVAMLDGGPDYVSALPIRVDGTCNGIQHLSAMVRDEVGGASVNLVPSDRPRDIYAEAASDLDDFLVELVASGKAGSADAAKWLAVRSEKTGKLPRSLLKQPVMVLPYGGSRTAYFRDTNEWIDDEAPQLRDGLKGKEPGQLTGFIIGHMRTLIEKRLSGAVATQKWLQACAGHAALGNQPIYWVTPSGFVVRHFYGQLKERRIETKIDGQKYAFLDKVPTDKLDKRDQLRGIAPNYTHSMDASALTKAINKAVEAGIKALTSIHDAYGTVAADMPAFTGLLREAFVEVYEHDVLAEYRLACQEVLATHLAQEEGRTMEEAMVYADQTLPAPLPRGKLDIHDVLRSDYFFA